MRFVKFKDEDRLGDALVNLDLARQAHFGGGVLRLYFEKGTTVDEVTFTGENAMKLWAALG